MNMYVHKICSYVNHLRSLVLIIPKAAFSDFFLRNNRPKISTFIYGMKLNIGPRIALE